MHRKAYPCLVLLYAGLLALVLAFYLLLSPVIPRHSPATATQPRHSAADDQRGSSQKAFFPMGTNVLRKKTTYPRRMNMGACPPAFGHITVLLVVEKHWRPLSSHYGVAQGSLECYLRTANYTFRRVDLNEDPKANQFCRQYQNLFFKKHCIVSAYLKETDWMLVLDADTGVVNPNHCVEEWIDDRVDFVFYERFFNWEIMSGNYLVKNTPFAHHFLFEWANMEFSQPKFSSADNGALQLLILKMVLPMAKIEIAACERYWRRSIDYDTYMAYVTCVRAALGGVRIWPPKLRILRRAHGFARDWFMTSDGWSELDFMFHGWKAHNVLGEWKSPFVRVPNASECTGGYAGWPWRTESRISVENARKQLAEQERSSADAFPKIARVHAHLSEPDIAECYPNCDDHI